MASSAPRKLINNYLGPYQLVEKIAEGGTAHIFTAQSPSFERNRQYVAKVLKPDLVDDRICQTGIRVEYETLAKLELAGFPKAHRFDSVAKLPGFIMDYVEGANVFRLVRDGVPFTRLAMLLNMCALVAKLHREDIIHNDVKPENFILTQRTGRLNLIDFGNIKRPRRRGITTIFQAKTLKRIRGTPAYMAPELLERKHPSLQSDVYALAACAHFLLTNRPIRSRKEAAEAIAQTRQAVEIRISIPELPHEANDILTRCLRIEPEARPGHAGILLKILKRSLPPELTEGRCPLSARLAEQAREEKQERMAKPVEEDGARPLPRLKSPRQKSPSPK